MHPTSPLCPPPALPGVARAVAAPASPALGVCNLKGQSGAGMINSWKPIGSLLGGLPVRATESARKRSAGATVARSQAIPDGNHGDNKRSIK